MEEQRFKDLKRAVINNDKEGVRHYLESVSVIPHPAHKILRYASVLEDPSFEVFKMCAEKSTNETLRKVMADPGVRNANVLKYLHEVHHVRLRSLEDAVSQRNIDLINYILSKPVATYHIESAINRAINRALPDILELILSHEGVVVKQGMLFQSINIPPSQNKLMTIKVVFFHYKEDDATHGLTKTAMFNLLWHVIKSLPFECSKMVFERFLVGPLRDVCLSLKEELKDKVEEKVTEFGHVIDFISAQN